MNPASLARGFGMGLVAWLLVAGQPAAAQPAAAQGESSCVTCHRQLEDEASAAWSHDVHQAAGLGCEACHGGDPDPSLAGEMEAAMSAKAGFRPAPGRLQVPAFCARCHSDADFMKRYDPQARVDQFAEYRTSAHGKANAAGDPVPATCIDCHGAHGVVAVTSPEAPVYATNVPETCAACHADAEKMKPYGLPTSQYADYRTSVHGAVLLVNGDTAAPACNDCHGNHGAAPPGVRSVAFVCGHCHGREAKLFSASFKKELFDDLEVGECTVCHGTHTIKHPTPELFHGATAPAVSAGEVLQAAPLEASLGDLQAGQTAEATWIVVLRPNLEQGDESLAHSVEVSVQGGEPLHLDATVSPGDPAWTATPVQAGPLTAVLDLAPTTGWPLASGDGLRMHLQVKADQPVQGLMVRDRPGTGVDAIAGSACLTCHTPGDACDVASEQMYDALNSLERDLKSAGALLRKAELSGMEVSGAQFDLKSQGRTASVEGRALIHAFDPPRLLARSKEGREVAAKALAAGEDALAELQFRRKGLGISLLLVLLVALGLVLKIRQVDRARGAPRRAS